jgi:hypothetical protein
MFQVEAISGLWSITHLTCGATFQLHGEKIKNFRAVRCPNCNQEFIAFPLVQAAVDNLNAYQQNIKEMYTVLI